MQISYRFIHFYSGHGHTQAPTTHNRDSPLLANYFFQVLTTLDLAAVAGCYASLPISEEGGDPPYHINIQEDGTYIYSYSYTVLTALGRLFEILQLLIWWRGR